MSILEAPEGKYTKLSEKLRRAAPNRIQCSFFCGGRQCKYESSAKWDQIHMAINGIFSHWVTDDVLAMARPSTELINKINLIEKFKSQGIQTVINLQESGEHASCGKPLEKSGFTYDPDIFMESSIYYYNFKWKDYGFANTNFILDIVKVISFALTQGKIAIHCHAGLGRTGVLIACYLIYSLRVHANDAIRFVRLKRPNSVQTRGQILCVQEFERYILPQTIIFCNKYLMKDTDCDEFTLSQFLERQRILLHGNEARAFKHIPKIIFILCERILKLCGMTEEDCGGNINDSVSKPFTQTFFVRQLQQKRPHKQYIHLSSSSASFPENSDFEDKSTSNDLDYERSKAPSVTTSSDLEYNNDEVSDTTVSSLCVSPDKPSCSSEMSVLDDDYLDTLLDDGIHGQKLHENVCYQEISSQADLRKVANDEKITPYSLEDVIEALVVDQTTLQEDVKKAIQQYRIDLNISPVAWSHLQLERKLYILTGILYEWLEHLKTPILYEDVICKIIIYGSRPEECVQKLDQEIQYVLEYILQFVGRLKIYSKQKEIDVLRRIMGSLTHQAVLIGDILKPTGKGYHKLRDGTSKSLMEFLTGLYELIASHRAAHIFT